MKEKAKWHIYLNNTIAYLIFNILNILFKKNLSIGKNLLFINTGQIGDLTISSVIFNNSYLFEEDTSLYFIIKGEYINLFQDYDGPIKIIKWKYKHYKYNPIYRVTFLLKLRKIGFKKTINLTAARGITNDELALLSGAEEVICLNSNWRYLRKLFGQKMDSRYDMIVKINSNNEYEKHICAVKLLTDKTLEMGTNIFISENTEKKVEESLKAILSVETLPPFISIAPMTDIAIKNWGIKNYENLINTLITKMDIVILIVGDRKQFKIFEKVRNFSNEKVFNLAGKFSIIESAALVKKSLLFIGNDSGFTHIAKAMNKKFVGIIGGGSFDYFFPYNISPNDNYLFHKLDCFGCEWRCKFDKPYCHQYVTVDDVVLAVEKLLPN